MDVVDYQRSIGTAVKVDTFIILCTLFQLLYKVSIPGTHVAQVSQA